MCTATGSIKIFTDGSICGASVACGACAAVLYSVCDDEPVCVESLAVGTKVSAFECEIELFYSVLIWRSTTLILLDQESLLKMSVL